MRVWDVGLQGFLGLRLGVLRLRVARLRDFRFGVQGLGVKLGIEGFKFKFHNRKTARTFCGCAYLGLMVLGCTEAKLCKEQARNPFRGLGFRGVWGLGDPGARNSSIMCSWRPCAHGSPFDTPGVDANRPRPGCCVGLVSVRSILRTGRATWRFMGSYKWGVP